MLAEISIGPQLGVCGLLGRGGLKEGLPTVRTGGVEAVASLPQGRVVVVLLDDLLVVVLDGVLVHQRRITGLELSFLRSTAGRTGPGKASRGLLQQGWSNAVHVIGRMTYGTLDRIVADHDVPAHVSVSGVCVFDDEEPAKRFGGRKEIGR